MNKHTPGPWSVVPDQPSHGACLCIVANATIIARTPECDNYGSNAQVEIDTPNAHLLAAAPDLLAAAQAALTLIQDTFSVEHGIESVGRAWGALHAAITKATGV